MPLSDFVEAGTTPRPLTIGRLTRLAFGAGLGSLFVWNFVDAYPAVIDRDFAEIGVGYWIGVGFAFWYLPDLFTVGLSRVWGRRPQAAVAGVAASLMVIDLVAYGALWAPPLGWAVFLSVQFALGFFALSFLSAALFRLRVPRRAPRAGAVGRAQGKGAPLKRSVHPSG